jgi:hypothetical protein
LERRRLFGWKVRLLTAVLQNGRCISGGPATFWQCTIGVRTGRADRWSARARARRTAPSRRPPHGTRGRGGGSIGGAMAPRTSSGLPSLRP